ncbi:hypothetical protein GGR57DRAFT_92196 [Xylariaceae sp. FL1272]|nr:hypothetical protein GGR57DRAFT_92196 [Xylariaceae sp. FL1272]
MSEHQWPESARKRARDDDEIEADIAANSPLGFTEHRNKRLQSLPFRTSPTQKRWAGPLNGAPNTITPSNSDSDPEDAQVYQHPMAGMDVDQDADMMVDGQFSSNFLQPGPSQPDPIAPSIHGRMPTPIHCTFAAQVRGNNWGAMQDEGGIAVMSQENDAFVQSEQCPHQDPSVPRSLEAAEWTMVQNRRLPSPISENGGEDSPGMMLDNCTPAMAQLQRPYLPHLPHSTNPHAMAMHPNIRTSPQPMESEMMDAEDGTTSAPATPSPRGKFGHSRSKHTLNNWTLQPGMKKSFSIGYRADCEKCRQKVPGHFNHIIVS